MEPPIIGFLPNGQRVYAHENGQVIVERDPRNRQYTIAVETGPRQFVTQRFDARDVLVRTAELGFLANGMPEGMARELSISMSVQALLQQQATARGNAHLRLPVDAQIGDDDGSWHPDRVDPVPSQPPEQPPTQTGPRPKLGERIVV